MTYTLTKCNLTMALLWCARDCKDLIAVLPKNGDSVGCISKALECRYTCIECMEAFESSKASVRGLLVQAVNHACAAFLKECELLPFTGSNKYTDSCRRCMEECENLMAFQDFSSFFNPCETVMEAS